MNTHNEHLTDEALDAVSGGSFIGDALKTGAHYVGVGAGHLADWNHVVGKSNFSTTVPAAVDKFMAKYF